MLRAWAASRTGFELVTAHKCCWHLIYQALTLLLLLSHPTHPQGLFSQLRPYMQQADDAGMQLTLAGHSLGGSLAMLLLVLHQMNRRDRCAGQLRRCLSSRLFLLCRLAHSLLQQCSALLCYQTPTACTHPYLHLLVCSLSHMHHTLVPHSPCATSCTTDTLPHHPHQPPQAEAPLAGLLHLWQPPCACTLHWGRYWSCPAGTRAAP